MLSLLCCFYYVGQPEVWMITDRTAWLALGYAAVFATICTYWYECAFLKVIMLFESASFKCISSVVLSSHCLL